MACKRTAIGLVSSRSNFGQKKNVKNYPNRYLHPFTNVKMRDTNRAAIWAALVNMCFVRTLNALQITYPLCRRAGTGRVKGSSRSRKNASKRDGLSIGYRADDAIRGMIVPRSM